MSLTDTRDRSPGVPVGTALVTGAGRGIGLATAQELARGGWRVFVACRDMERAQRITDELNLEGCSADPVRLDVTDATTVTQARRVIEEAVGTLDVLVNNAAVLLETIPSLPSTVSPDLIAKTYDVNAIGPFRVIVEFLPLLDRSECGSVINLTSRLASAPSVSDKPLQEKLNLVAYNSSKAALNSVSRAFALELRGRGIHVNAVDPGHSATDMNDHSGERSPHDAAKVVVEAATVLGRRVTGCLIGPEGLRAW